MGLAPLLVREIFEIVRQINAAGMTHTLGGAECPYGVVGSRYGLCIGDRQDRVFRPGPGSGCQQAGTGGLPGGIMQLRWRKAGGFLSPGSKGTVLEGPDSLTISQNMVYHAA